MNLYESIKVNKIDKNKIIKNKAMPANNQYNVEAENKNEKRLDIVEKLANDFIEYLRQHEVYAELDDYSISENPRTNGIHGVIDYNISWGDWKHEHQYSKNLAKEFFNQDFYISDVVYEEDGSDTYSATHEFVFDLAPYLGKEMKESSTDDLDLYVMHDAKSAETEEDINSYLEDYPKVKGVIVKVGNKHSDGIWDIDIISTEDKLKDYLVNTLDYCTDEEINDKYRNIIEPYYDSLLGIEYSEIHNSLNEAKSARVNIVKESSTGKNSAEEYWHATEITRDAFAALLKFDFGSDYRGNNYIITIDCYEAERFYADSDEEAIKIYEDWKKAKDDGAIEYHFNNHYKQIAPRNMDELNESDEEYLVIKSYDDLPIEDFGARNTLGTLKNGKNFIIFDDNDTYIIDGDIEELKKIIYSDEDEDLKLFDEFMDKNSKRADNELETKILVDTKRLSPEVLDESTINEAEDKEPLHHPTKMDKKILKIATNVAKKLYVNMDYRFEYSPDIQDKSLVISFNDRPIVDFFEDYCLSDFLHEQDISKWSDKQIEEMIIKAAAKYIGFGMYESDKEENNKLNLKVGDEIEFYSTGYKENGKFSSKPNILIKTKVKKVYDNGDVACKDPQGIKDFDYISQDEIISVNGKKLKEADENREVKEDLNSLASMIYNITTDMDVENNIDMEEEPDYIQNNYKEFVDKKIEDYAKDLNDADKDKLRKMIYEKLQNNNYIRISKADNKLNESSTEERWNATELDREGFYALLKFNNPEEHANPSLKYIITRDGNEVYRFAMSGTNEKIKDTGAKIEFRNFLKSKNNEEIEESENKKIDEILDDEAHDILKRMHENLNMISVDENHFEDIEIDNLISYVTEIEYQAKDLANDLEKFDRHEIEESEEIKEDNDIFVKNTLNKVALDKISNAIVNIEDAVSLIHDNDEAKNKIKSIVEELENYLNLDDYGRPKA